jgi:hypothetical protein
VLTVAALWALEIRDRQWSNRAVFDLLSGLDLGLGLHDTQPRHPRVVTGGWGYLPYHGDHHSSSYAFQWLSVQAKGTRRLVSEDVAA